MTLPELKVKDAELITRLELCPSANEPLLVIEPDALRVSVELVAALSTLTAAPEATVKSPSTATVTFALVKADDNAVAIEESMVSPSGSSNQLPFLPAGADALTVVVGATTSLRRELVSTVPPLPPSAPPVALKLPATLVCSLDQTLISPPLPLWVDDTSTVAPTATVTVFAKF